MHCSVSEENKVTLTVVFFSSLTHVNMMDLVKVGAFGPYAANCLDIVYAKGQLILKESFFNSPEKIKEKILPQ